MSANANCIAFMLEAPNSRWKQVVAVQSDICLAVGVQRCESIAALPFLHLRQIAHRPCVSLTVLPVDQAVQSMGHGS